MFYECDNLKNIYQLKYLNTKNINNFSNMFGWCTSLSDIKSLEKWNVSNGNNFSNMFGYCTSLSDINNTINKWNISKSLLQYIK